MSLSVLCMSQCVTYMSSSVLCMSLSSELRFCFVLRPNGRGEFQLPWVRSWRASQITAHRRAGLKPRLYPQCPASLLSGALDQSCGSETTLGGGSGGVVLQKNVPEYTDDSDLV